MSERTLTKADLMWIIEFLDEYETLLEQYPELFTKDRDDTVKVVRQLVEEKL